MQPLVYSAMVLALISQQAPEPSPGGEAEPPSVFKPEPNWKSLGRSLWFDAESNPKRVIIRCRVVLREGPLEHLLCLRGTKEHEAIVSTDAAPTQIHAGLLLTGAEPGSPVQFRPEFRPPMGPPIDMTFQWKEGDDVREADARTWIRDDKAEKALDVDWIFAGSLLYEDPITKKTVYAAQDGDLITVANFASAILDLPIVSSADDAERSFVAYTEKIPPVGTEVRLILSPKPQKTQPSPKAR